jgi:hypothetical protein
MFAGQKQDLPVNKPGKPKIGLFPNSSVHDPMVMEFTYKIPLNTLPPAGNPGFIVASHCVVHSPYGQTETAWAEGDYKFTDKDWGWYDDYYYDQNSPPITFLYGTEYRTDSLRIFQLDVTNTSSAPVLIWEEYVGDNSGTYDATAYDEENHIFYFTNYNTRELWKVNMGDTSCSTSTGSLDGIASSATFYDHGFYYIDEVSHNIIRVEFDEEGYISSETTLSTLPSSVIVTDIAMSPAGDYMYILGNVNNGGTEMITWDISADAYATIDLEINQGSQIAFGTDGNLYAIEPNGGSGTIVYLLDPETGVTNPITDDPVIIIDPFSDLSSGPTM